MLSSCTAQQDCHGSQGNKEVVISGAWGGLGEGQQPLEPLRGWEEAGDGPWGAAGSTRSGAGAPRAPWHGRTAACAEGFAGPQLVLELCWCPGGSLGGLCWCDPWGPSSTAVCSCHLLRSKAEGPGVSLETSSEPWVPFCPRSPSMAAIPGWPSLEVKSVLSERVIRFLVLKCKLT